ncbi:DUF6680 family protein [Chachezhania antarctica]|uniref:DUF6680 family protein n=1 Tax=Chachezhania antarctica TaxID=2340860 RepID=UPI0013CF1887|nr:DUF6680 family protein [Chachezhania antarctica]
MSEFSRIALQDWLTLCAIVLGPLTAVMVAHYLQTRDRRRERRMAIFRTLMGTRRAQLSLERVAALNLVEVEFSRNAQVIIELNKLLLLYNDKARWRSADSEILEGLIREVEDQNAQLTSEMGKVLGYAHEQIKLLRGGYRPEAFNIAEDQQSQIREFALDLKDGKRALPIEVVDVRHAENILRSARESQEILEHAARKETKDDQING